MYVSSPKFEGVQGNLVVSPRVGDMGYVEDTVKGRGKYVVGMGVCVVLCVELCSCMLKGLLGRCKQGEKIKLTQNPKIR